MEIIPAIDLLHGQVVRLEQGEFSRVRKYEVDPCAVAQRYESLGFKRLHLVDLEGAKDGTSRRLDVLRIIVSTTSLQVQYGGGIRSVEDAQAAFDAGAAKVVVGSIAVKNAPMVKEWIHTFGAERVIPALDAREGKVATEGWRIQESATLEECLMPFAEYRLEVLCTDIARDGLLQGANVELYARLSRLFPQFSFIASGGVKDESDFSALSKVGIRACVVGKALLEGRLEGICSQKE